MILRSRWLVGGFLLGCTFMWIARNNGNVLAAQQHKPIMFTRLYTGTDGQTHAEEVDVKLTPWVAMSGTARSDAIKVGSIQFSRSSPGRFNDWHPASQRQYVITLSGQGEMEVAGGRKVSFTPGRILFAEDLTGKGHTTRTVGTEDWTSVIVQLGKQ